MRVRLWYPQLDVYDAIRRIVCLLNTWDMEHPPTPERMFIVDFYLANPPLLHKTNMSADTRAKIQWVGHNPAGEKLLELSVRPYIVSENG